MRLTPFAKVFITIVILAIIGYIGWHYRDKLPKVGKRQDAATATTGTSTTGTATSTAPGAAPAQAQPNRTGVLASIRQTKVLRVGMEPDAPPLHFINENQQEDGFDFQMAARIGKQVGTERVRVVEADYGELPALLRKGDIDVIMAGYVPDPTIEGVDWSNGYLDFGLCMIVQEGMLSTYRDVSDLAGKVVAIYDDPAAEKWVRANIPNVTIRKFSGDSGWFEAVENGQADALIYDYPFAAVEIKEHPRTVIAKYNLNKSKYAVGVPAGNYDLVYEINKALDQIKESDQYATLMKTYLASKSEAFMKPVAGKRTHRVVAGDTLSKIARRELGNPERWEEIWKLNTQRVADPNLIYPGLVLILP
jgi:ABC-type amino acid transport substrate-binding protein